jgi:hypothetical protein
MIASHAAAAQYVYPTQGQDQARQAKDEADCSAWAIQQTGFDPSKAPAAASLGGASNALTSTATTAALGAIPGAGNLAPAAGMLSAASGQGSSASALGGVAASAIPGVGGQAAGVIGMLNQAGAQQQPAKPGQAEYDQARGACLSGRGYSVR